MAGRGEEDTRKLDRLPGEKPGTEVRSARAEAGSGRLLEWSLGTLFLLAEQEKPQEKSATEDTESTEESVRKLRSGAKEQKWWIV